jgi:hypothetical protein
MVVELPAVGPLTVLVVDVVPVTTGVFVVADKVVELVAVASVEVVLVELVEEVELVDESDVVVVVIGAPGVPCIIVPNRPTAQQSLALTQNTE